MSHYHKWRQRNLMTSSNGNIFRVTGPLWGESTSHRLISLTKGSEAELWCFLCVWTSGWANNRDTDDFRRHRAHYDVIVRNVILITLTTLTPWKMTFYGIYSILWGLQPCNWLELVPISTIASHNESIFGWQPSNILHLIIIIMISRAITSSFVSNTAPFHHYHIQPGWSRCNTNISGLEARMWHVCLRSLHAVIMC